MSDIIKLLPDSVANQIAAGEVIQRPASVIKELVENAIDAGATAIQIVLKDAGKTLIQVIDNGSGMSDTDARLAFERHATSKIKTAEDLFALRTMGFRGEALASIAAIAQVELRTRKQDAAMGTHICISGSQFESQEPDYCQAGANFMIKNIFYNVPARRKFLKNNQTELSNIVKEFEKLALVNHTVEFELSHNGNVMYQLMAGDSFKQRIVSLFSRTLDRQLIPIKTETSLVSVNGFVCRPENARKRNALQYFFVNGRHMKHPYFHKAVMQSYDQLIPAEEQPNYFLNFTVDPDTIDVNIHPTKSEIKFENEQVIWQILFAAIKEALGKFSAVPSIEFDMEGAVDIPEGQPSGDLHMPEIEIDPTYNPFKQQSHKPAAAPASGGHRETRETTARELKVDDANLRNWDALYQSFQEMRNDSIQQTTTSDGATHSTVEVMSRPLMADTSTTEERVLSQEAEPLQISGLDTEFSKAGAYVQLKNKYIVMSGKSGLLIIDQNRAHIRSLYEKFLEMKKLQHIEAQQILFQEVLNLSASQSLLLESLQEELGKCGFDLSFLGNNSWSVNSTPSGLEKIHVTDFITDLIESVTTGGLDASQRIVEAIALSSARSAAIPYGQRLSQDEMDELVGSLFRTKEPNYTPDGKKIICTLPLDDISKMFA